LSPEINYEPTKGTNVKGISDVLSRTTGTLLLKWFTLTHETSHLFHVIGDNFDFRYYGILDQEIWKGKRSTIDYCNSVIIMGDVVMDFDDEPEETTEVNHILTLKSRPENIVRMSSKSRRLGIISKGV